MNTLESFNIPKDLRLAPETPKTGVRASVGKYWGNFWGSDTSSLSVNKRRGEVILTSLGAASLALIALASCSIDSAPGTACERTTNNTVTVDVAKGDTEDGILIRNIHGVNYGACLDTAKVEAVRMNGPGVVTPREGDRLVLPAELVAP